MNLKPYFDAAQAADAKVLDLANRINDHFEGGRTDEALKLRPELDEAKKAAKAANQLYLSMRDAAGDGADPARRFVPASNVDPGEPKETKDLLASSEYRDLWMEAMKNGVTPKTVKAGQHSAEHYAPLMNAISETGGSPVGSEGGFLNPVEFDGMIHERMRQFHDLADDINVEEVTAYSGWRVVETTTASEPFETLTELETQADEDETESPTFTKVDYTVVDKGGFLRVSNSQLSDTPVQIMRYLARWFGRKAVLTDNAAILALINALTPADVTDVDNLITAMKTALNVTLDPDIAAAASIFTNQSGFDILDKLVDDMKRPMLQPDPTSPTSFRFKGRPVVMLADRLWANLDSGVSAPIAIGNGQEYATLFRRLPFEMASTNIGGSSWRSNSTEVRGIMRLDCKEVDDEAMTLISVTIGS